MINLCAGCGLYRADKTVDQERAVAICPECGHEHPYLFQPLYLIGGPSGTGKTSVLERLLRRNLPVVLLESDILWRHEFNKPEENYREYHELWLRLAKNIAQNRQPVAIFGAGFCVPENTETCMEARYFSQIHRLAIVCDDELVAARLRARPAWRNAGTDAFVEQQIEFNRWCKQRAANVGDIDLLETSQATIDQTADALLVWFQDRSVPSDFN